MPAVLLGTQQASQTATAYAANCDYLSDELRRLDLLIQLRHDELLHQPGVIDPPLFEFEHRVESGALDVAVCDIGSGPTGDAARKFHLQNRV